MTEAAAVTPPIQCAKGASKPYEASDTLKSTQRAEIVDLLGEGQIGGLVNGLKSVYLDGVPVENADGANFAERPTAHAGGRTSEADHASATSERGGRRRDGAGRRARGARGDGPGDRRCA